MEKLIGLVLVFGIALNLSSASTISEDISVVRICNASDPVDVQIFNDYMMHHNFNHLETENQHNLACFLLCIYSEYRWMDRHGRFKVHNIKTWMVKAGLSEYDTEFLLRKCLVPEFTDPCNRARKFTECFWTNHQGSPGVNRQRSLHSMIRKKDAE